MFSKTFVLLAFGVLMAYSANQGVASLRAGVAGKVDDNAEAIASIDAYRVAINSRLADIDRRLGVLAGSGGQ